MAESTASPSSFELDVVLALTGITLGRLVDGVRERHGNAVTSSLLLTGSPPTARFLQTWHAPGA